MQEIKQDILKELRKALDDLPPEDRAAEEQKLRQRVEAYKQQINCALTTLGGAIGISMAFGDVATLGQMRQICTEMFDLAEKTLGNDSETVH
jgi:hypothetical protein